MAKVAVLGYGTVGSGVVEVIEKNNAQVSKNSMQETHVKYILDLRDFPGDPYEKLVIHDFNIILNDPEVQIVCEVMGGVGAAYQFTKQCLEKGKSVCTSNKELVAKHGPELISIAKANNCSYLFEASVGGGIPIIRPINKSLTAEKIERIAGILNGTTNYILTKMEKEGASFDKVLKEAQDKGYAERNPEADIEGHDACRKIAILSSLMTGKNVDSEKIYTEGITNVTATDFLYAQKAGYTIKLLGISETVGDKVLTMVAPFFLKKNELLANVEDVFNAILVTGNMLGDSLYYGRGAGKLPTASAVVSDVIECARHEGKNLPIFWDAEDVELAQLGDTRKAFFVRVDEECLNSLMAALPGGQVIVPDNHHGDAGYITPVVSENEYENAVKPFADKIFGRIRVYA